MTGRRVVSHVVAAVLLGAGAGRAQTMSMFPFLPRVPEFSARFLHLLPNRGSIPLTDGTLDLMAAVPLGSRFSTFAAIPVTHDSKAEGRDVIIGDLMLGLQLTGDTTGRTAATFALCLPSAAKGSSTIPLYVNRYEIHRYAPNFLSAYFNVAGVLAGGQDYALHGEVGTTIYTATTRADTSMVSLHYGLGASVGSPDVRCVVEFTGIVNFADSFEGLAERFLNFVTLGAVFLGKRVQPGLVIQLPFNQSLRSVIDGALGATVAVMM